MSFNPNPEVLNYCEIIEILKGLKDQAYKEVCRLEVNSDFTNPKDKERFCYWAGEKEGLNKALFYIWDAGQVATAPKSHPIRSHHFFLDKP